MSETVTSPIIGTLTERSLHAGLKVHFAQPTDELEVRLDGFVIDIKQENRLIEIQTRHLGAMKRKLTKLLKNHSILLVHPIAQLKWIRRETAEGVTVSRRKSPKKGTTLDIFRELIRIPHLLAHENLTIGVALVEEEAVWRDDGQGSWRRKKWSVVDRELVRVVDVVEFGNLADWVGLLPESLPAQFTNKELAVAGKCRHDLAQKITYTLRKCGVLEVVGKQGNANLHEIQI
jgi:hypothetical protein